MAGRLVTVADTTVFIGLTRVGQLALLDAFFEEVTVMPAVFRELAGRPEEAAEALSISCVRLHTGEPDIHPATSALDKGEQEVISFAVARGLRIVLLDEKRARDCAASLGLEPRGVLGLLVHARRTGRLADLRGCFCTLLAAGFRLPLDVVNAQLLACGEEPI